MPTRDSGLDHRLGCGTPTREVPRSRGGSQSVVWAVLLLAAIGLAEPVSRGPETAAAAEEPAISPLDLHRIEEAYHLTDVLGDELWPTFDLRKVPIVVNNRNVEEILIGHPNPPPEFRLWEGRMVGGNPVYRREGCTRYGPKSGGWAVSLGGAECAYVGVKQHGPTEEYLLLLLHEGFHVFQTADRPSSEAAQEDPPEDDAVYSAMLGLEARIIHEALITKDDQEARRLACMFVAVRRERRRPLAEDVVRSEIESEYAEGTATYTGARVAQLLAGRGGIKPVYPGEDPDYKGFAMASESYNEHLESLIPQPGVPLSFDHGMYEIGMAQGLVLDRFRPAWKKEIAEPDCSQATLMERTFKLSEVECDVLVKHAKERFLYRHILEEQTAEVNERKAIIRGYVEAKGRTYRVLHGEIAGRFKWQPAGPVYRDGDRTIWAGGLRRFEKGPLLFESREVPIIFSVESIEWVDTQPDPEGKDMNISCSERSGDIFDGLVMETDGFRLQIPRARLEIGKDLVTVQPMETAPQTSGH
ncbi:MAG: hypothetical protein AB1714_21505 [Acidobacteriota bacterium]